MNREKAMQSIADWIVQSAMTDLNLDDFFVEFCERVANIGIPLYRLQMALSILHPTMAAKSLTWRKGVGISIDSHAHSTVETDQWLQSPMRAVLENNLPEIRQSLEVPDDELAFPILNDLKAEGATDYYMFPVTFDSGKFHFHQVAYDRNRRDGMIISWASDTPGGFNADDIAAINRLTSRLSIVVKLWVREQISLNVASAYMGPQVGKRVLDGQIRRGDVELIHAVIWYTDLRHSTDMADTLPLDQVMEALDRYFDCTAGAVIDNGGQVLRFIGDAVLAIFPFQKGSTIETQNAHINAYRAALDAFERMKDVNKERAKGGVDELSFGLGLHTGELLFGNIGVPERVEFSVIGGTANEVARIEGMTKELAVPALFTQSFTDHLADVDWQTQGSFNLRGVKASKTLFSTPELG